MKINSGELIKKMRKDMNISRVELAKRLHISTRHFSRIEAGLVELDVWQFLSVLEIMGQPTEDFWLLYLDTNEYEDYKAYRRIKRLLRDDFTEEARGALLEFEKKDLSRRSFISQFICIVKIALNDNIPHDEALAGLNQAMRMSRQDYDENKVSGYRLTYNEIFSLSHIAIRLRALKETDRAISLYKAITVNRENVRASEEDKAAIFPTLMFNLSNTLGQTGRYKEALLYCNQAIEICKEYNNLRFIPMLLYNIACCHLAMGEEERVWKIHLTRAYHCAYAIGDNEAAQIIKSDAEESFGVTNL